MKLTVCDICGEVINSKMYRMVISEELTGNELSKVRDFNAYVEKTLNNVEVYEVCENCKKVFDSLLAMRKEELKKLKEKFNKISGEKQDDL